MLQNITPPIVTKTCKQCGLPKQMYADLATCDDCIQPLLKTLWGEDYWKLATIGKPQPVESPEPKPAPRNHRKGRRTRS